MNFYQHHIGDYDSHTAHLTWLEDAAYRRLMCLYYRTEKPIPADVAQACRLIRATSKQEREAVQQVLKEFFTLQEDGWHSARCDQEIAKAQAKAERNREVGKMGGRPKQKETRMVSKNKPSDNPDGFQKEPKDNPIQTPDSKNQKPEEESTHVAERNTTEPNARAAGDETPPDPNSAGAMAGTLRRLLVDITSQNPVLLAWISDGYTTAQIVESAEIAAQRKPGERIPAKYLDAIVRGQASQTPSAGGAHGSTHPRQQSSKPSLAERATNARKEYERRFAEREAHGEPLGEDDSHLRPPVVVPNG